MDKIIAFVVLVAVLTGVIYYEEGELNYFSPELFLKGQAAGDHPFPTISWTDEEGETDILGFLGDIVSYFGRLLEWFSSFNLYETTPPEYFKPILLPDKGVTTA